ncbi:MAG TPA: HAMP domain-containing sensor histidine kinase, partial [Thermoanaerobaculia bacterium]|nr:HAMP domain-containing sensor histidine kinase [Thermoanaerobaculia bacterium]
AAFGLRYVMAVAATSTALAADLFFRPAFESHRFAPFIFAIVVVAFFGDLGSALFATLLAIVATNYFDFLLLHRVQLDADDVVQLSMFAAIAVSISFATARRRRAERELAEANVELRALDRAKDRFIAAVSHELRTPVTAILGWAELLQEPNGEEIRPAAAAAIEQSARTQARLIEDLLDMSRLMLGKLNLQIEPVAFKSIVADVAKIIEPSAEASAIAVRLTLPRDACIVGGDAVRLRQICWNLLQNAVKFTPPGGSVRVELMRMDGWLQLTIEDDGVGMSKDLLARIFEPFRQGDGAANKGGLGLGLSIVRELVSAHHGTIDAQSDGEGKGSRFVVRLPLAEREEKS